MAACMDREMNSRVPVIVILGATGSGKSKLGIEIARRFEGEILSADSMQVYKGLDIVTNKVTAEDRCLAPHHLLDIVEPLQRFTVLDFRNRAVPIIDKMIQTGKLPVIVGGTNYYIESLLWKVLVEEDETSLGVFKEAKSTSNVEGTLGDSVDVGGTLKEHVGDRIETCTDNSDSAKLLEVTCQKEVLNKCSVAKFHKRVLDCGTEIVSTKCKKLQRCDVGLNALNSRCQMDTYTIQSPTKLETEVDCVCERPNVDSTECLKNLDQNVANVAQVHGMVFSQKFVIDQETCQDKGSEEDMGLRLDGSKPVITELPNKMFSTNDVGETQTGVHGEGVGEDQTVKNNMLEEVCQEESMVDGADVSGCVKMCYKTEGLMQIRSVGSEQVVCLDNNRQRSRTNSELAYERDRRRLQEAPNQRDPEHKNVSVERDVVDLLDEEALECVPSSHLYERLQAVDPDMAKGLHPNNKRKIIRSLQVYAQTNRTHSAILREQRSADGGSELGGPLRYPHSCILWLQCKQEVLDERLDLRVDAMLEQGLLKELLDFHLVYNKERLATSTEADYTKGIFQAIGFKEFHQYLLLSEEDRNSEKGSRFFHEGVNALKLVTKRYARRQLRWINNRFLRKTNRQVPPVYGLDTTDPYFWNERVLGPAVKIVESYLEGQKPDGVEPLPFIEQSVKNDLKIKHCDVCDRMFVGDIQWNNHLQSKKHRRMLKRKQVP